MLKSIVFVPIEKYFAAFEGYRFEFSMLSDYKISNFIQCFYEY